MGWGNVIRRGNRGLNYDEASEEEDEINFGGGFQGGGNWRPKKLYLPISRNNQDGCIIVVERFFNFYHLSEDGGGGGFLGWRHSLVVLVGEPSSTYYDLLCVRCSCVNFATPRTLHEQPPPPSN